MPWPGHRFVSALPRGDFISAAARRLWTAKTACGTLVGGIVQNGAVIRPKAIGAHCAAGFRYVLSESVRWITMDAAHSFGRGVYRG
jgi:hypothetical protein